MSLFPKKKKKWSIPLNSLPKFTKILMNHPALIFILLNAP